MDQRKKRAYLYGVLAAFVLLLAGAVIWRQAASAGKNFLMIDKAPVEKEEFLLFAEEEIAGASAFFYQEYGLDSNQPDFWTTEVEGLSPAEYVMERSLERIIRAKAEQQMMEEYGIIESTEYDVFLENYQKENRERQEETLVYGPSSLGLHEFYSYYYGNKKQELITVFKQKDYHPKEEELLAYYEQLKKEGLQGEVTGEMVFYGIAEEKSQEDLLEELQRLLLLGEEEAGEDLVTKRFRVSRSTAGKEEEALQELASWMETAQVKELTGPLFMDGAVGYVQLENKSQGELPSWEQIRETVKWMYGDLVLEQRLEERCRNAKVKADEPGILEAICEFCTN